MPWAWSCLLCDSSLHSKPHHHTSRVLFIFLFLKSKHIFPPNILYSMVNLLATNNNFPCITPKPLNLFSPTNHHLLKIWVLLLYSNPFKFFPLLKVKTTVLIGSKLPCQIYLFHIFSPLLRIPNSLAPITLLWQYSILLPQSTSSFKIFEDFASTSPLSIT